MLRGMRMTVVALVNRHNRPNIVPVSLSFRSTTTYCILWDRMPETQRQTAWTFYYLRFCVARKLYFFCGIWWIRQTNLLLWSLQESVFVQPGVQWPLQIIKRLCYMLSFYSPIWLNFISQSTNNDSNKASAISKQTTGIWCQQNICMIRLRF